MLVELELSEKLAGDSNALTMKGREMLVDAYLKHMVESKIKFHKGRKTLYMWVTPESTRARVTHTR